MVTSEIMEDNNGVFHGMEESEVDAQMGQTRAQAQANNTRSSWSNGNCLFYMHKHQNPD